MFFSQKSLGPVGAIKLLELFKHDLHLLPIGGIHCYEMDALATTFKCGL